MSDIKSRITQITNLVTGSMVTKVQDPSQIPWDPDNEEFPTLGKLPKIPDAPEDAAWVWGKDDHLGRVNLLTPTRVKAAAAEIKTGEMVTVNLPLDEPNPPAFNRKSIQHTLIPLGGAAFDDERELLGVATKNVAKILSVSVNTQASSQWDGFRHIGHPSGLFYNGATKEAIISSSATSASSSYPAGIHHIAEHGIVSRAILLDYHTWSQSNSSALIDPFVRDVISLESLLACAKSQGLNLTPAAKGGDVKPGDILLIRIGWTAKYRSMPPSEWQKYAQLDKNDQVWAGIDGDSAELKAWIHDCYFTAVASDNPALEAWPPLNWSECLHTSLIPLWGCMIGEFFDLERLSELCRERGRWTMFFSSTIPIVKGGVAGLPNAMAIL